MALRESTMRTAIGNLGTMKLPLAFAVIPLVLLFAFNPTAAQTGGGGPKFYAMTKSYFELRFDNTKGTWQAAKNLAESKTYKGVRGRLAVVQDPEVHSFLRRNFKTNVESWIGLRYWCSFRKVQWVTGEVLKTNAFAIWANPWDRRDIPFCEGASSRADGYMPVYYLPSNLGFRWQAVNSGKHFKQYFVEYPARSQQTHE